MVAAWIAMAMAMTRPVSVADIVQSAEISGVALSPDARFVAYRIARADIATNGYRQAWYVATTDGRTAPRRVADAGLAMFTEMGGLAGETPIWLPDGSGFVFRALLRGKVSLWRADLASDVATEIAPGENDVRDFRLSVDGSQVFFRAGPGRAAVEAAERAAYDQGVLVDARVDLTQPLVGGVLIGGERRMQRFAGSWFRRQLLLDTQPLATKSVPVQGTGTSATLLATAPPQANNPGLSASGDYAALTIDPSGRQRLTVKRRQGQVVACTAAPCRSGRIVSIAWVAGEDRLAITLEMPGSVTAIHEWEVGRTTTRNVAQGPGQLDGGVSGTPCSIGHTRIACVDAAAIAPPRLIVIDLATGRRAVLDDPNAGLRARIATTAQRVDWDVGPGQHFTGQLLLPSEMPARPLPLVIHYYHCDGFLRGGVGDELPMLPLVKHGIAILCVNRVRTAGGDEIADYRLAQQALEQIIGQLSDQGLVDRTRIGMAGLSFGSDTTLWMLRHSKLLSAAALASASIEPAYYWYNALPGRDVPDQLERQWKLGSPDSDPERWKLVSAARDAASITAPVLMQLPESEARYQIELYARLLRLGRPVELYAFADEPHVKNQPRHKAAVYARNLDWFRFWLKGDEATGVEKASQYLRWRALLSARSEHIE